VVVLDPEGHYDGLIEFFQTMIAGGFAGASLWSLFVITKDPAAAVNLLGRQTESVPDKWDEMSHR
jgi:hypothetical protein